MKTINRITGEPSWRYRRIVIMVTIAFCMIVIGMLINGADSQLNGTIATGAYWLLTALVLIYTGFATIQDVTAIIVARTGRPYADIPPAEPPTVQADTVIVNQNQQD